MGEDRESKSHVVGTMQGMFPGVKVEHVGVLDLRGVPGEQVARIEKIHVVNVILLDEENRSLLDNVKLEHVGSVVVATPGERVVVTPHLDISRAAMEGMPGEQNLLIVGNAFFAPDVDPAQVADKIVSLRVVGILVASEAVYGALLGKMQFVNGVNLTLPRGVGPIVRDTGESRMTPEYLSSLPEGTTYLNFGRTEIAGDLDPDLLRRQIAAYYNLGETTGPERLISVLRARCPVNLGQFRNE